MPVKLDDKILSGVEKPARYTGGEWNIVKKDPANVDIRFAFCFPDVYEVGMSHLGMKILYHLINSRTDAYCERVFAPWTDMEAAMRKSGIPLFALETHDPVKDFDIVGFTLQYEMSYTNILNMLDLAGIPLHSNERTADDPFVCAGGPCAYNPEPLADFIDFFVIGEGEEVINEILDEYLKWKGKGRKRQDFLEKIALIEGVYVPSLYNVEYNEDGTLSQMKPKDEKFPEKIRKRIVHDLNNSYFPEEIIVPYTSIVHDRIMLELFRGCTHGCRFCQAGFVYRPVREKSAGTLEKQASKLIDSTGYEEISLTSLSTSDYSGICELTDRLLKLTADKKINLSLPSMRVDSFTLNIMEKVNEVRKGGLTFAPEAGTQRMRDVINKGVNEEDLVNSVRIAFSGGWNNIKLYFMVGLPGEKIEDVLAIADMGYKILDLNRKQNGQKVTRGLNITISTSSFIPKPFTPFQWEAQDSIETLREKQRALFSKIKSKFMKYSWNDPELSLMEAVFARGDRRTARALENAWRKGCKFDSWSEYFRMDLWREAFSEAGLEPGFYANRKREYTELLPWDHIDIGVTKEYLVTESKQAGSGEITDGCAKACNACGAGVFNTGICIEKRSKLNADLRPEDQGH